MVNCAPGVTRRESFANAGMPFTHDGWTPGLELHSQTNKPPMKRIAFPRPLCVALALAGGLGSTSEALAQTTPTPSYESHPAYLDLRSMLSLEEADVITEVNLRPNLLKFLRAMAAQDEPELASAFEEIEYVQVRVFEVKDENYAGLDSAFSHLHKTLAERGWEDVVLVKKPAENVHILSLPGPDDTIGGLTVLVLEPEDGVVVNIVGNLDPERLRELGENCHLDALKDLPEETPES